MTVYRTEYYEDRLGKWVCIHESRDLEKAKDYLDTPIIKNPEKRIAEYSKTGTYKVKYKYIKTVK
jgi:NDP-sugar pyrophosphorylase family protein